MPHKSALVHGSQHQMPLPFDLLQEKPSPDDCEPAWNIFNFEDTRLYRSIGLQTRAGMKEAYDHILCMRPFEFKKRSQVDQSTYLHHLVNQVPGMHRKYGTLIDLVPIIYQLALKGVVVNAQNKHGNTCLHLACIRPNAKPLAEHLLRIGVDPCIANNHGCRVVHTINNNFFQMVKGEADVRSGLWSAVKREDLAMVERLMNSWCRVDVARNKTFMDLAEETGNDKVMGLLNKHRLTNEMVCAAYACDVPLVDAITKQGPINFKTRNSCYYPERPLVVCLSELSYWTQAVRKVLLKYGATPAEEFKKEEEEHRQKFEKSALYCKLAEFTVESLNEAAELILEGKVDTRLVSYRPETFHWSYLHYIADTLVQVFLRERDKSRLLTRCVYRLALAGIDVNARCGGGNTALHYSAKTNNQVIINHFLRIGIDSMIMNAEGYCVALERYYGKGQIVLTKKCRTRDLPGLTSAVKRNDLSATRRWLQSGARVNCKIGDRCLIDVARSLKRTEILNLLQEHKHLNEFMCTVFSSDYSRMMNILALGDADKKVNLVDQKFPTGLIVNYRCEYVPRPVVLAAIVLGTPQVLDFLLKFKADLSSQYEERPPCGPLAFWAFQPQINNNNVLVVVRYADVTMRDEVGCTMLHRIISKESTSDKLEIVKILLERNINVAARDVNGYTPRDYTYIYPYGSIGQEIRQILDDHVLDFVKLDNLIEIEQLVLSGYNHIVDIRDSSKNKTAMEIAESKQYYDMQMFLKKMDSYYMEIKLLQLAVIKGDMMAVSKHSMEKKCAQCTTKGGKTLLHLAVLFEQFDTLVFLLDHFPNLINRADNIGRTALHYCVCLEDRLTFWPPLQDAGAEPAMTDMNNLSVYDYVKQLKNPVPTHKKSRARQWRDYKPTAEFVEMERRLVMERLQGDGEGVELKREDNGEEDSAFSERINQSQYPGALTLEKSSLPGSVAGNDEKAFSSSDDDYDD